MTVDLFDFPLGRPSTVTLSESFSGFSDSNIDVQWTVSDPDSDAGTLYLAWYLAGGVGKTAKEVADGEEALGTLLVDLDAEGYDGDYTISNLLPITEYEVRAVVQDKRGNLSLVNAIDARTTELSAPVVAAVHSFVTSPTYVGFTSSNEPDTSDMLFVAGVLTSPSPALTPETVLDNFEKFAFSNIPANADLDIPVLFSVAYDPSDLSAPPVSVVEAVTYYPFVFYQDAESNATLEFPPQIDNPDVTPPFFTSDPVFLSATATTVDVSYAMEDAVGITLTKAYVTLLDEGEEPIVVPDATTVLTQGDTVSASGTVTLENYHSTGAAQPLLHTGKYRAYIASTDAGTFGTPNVSAVSNVDVVTLDGAEPTIDVLEIVSDGFSNAVVSWEASDEGPHGDVSAVHILSTSNALPSNVAPSNVLSNVDTIAFYDSNASATFSNVPAYESTFIYAVAEDTASDFGNGSNLLSAVTSNVMNVPAFSNPVVFSQSNASYHVEFADANVDVDAGPVQAYLVLYKSGDEPTEGAAASNAVLTSDFGVETSGL